MKMSGRSGCGIVAEPVVQKDNRKLVDCRMLQARRERKMG